MVSYTQSDSSVQKNPKVLRSENIQISSQIWQSAEKENLFFGLDDKMLHI